MQMIQILMSSMVDTSFTTLEPNLKRSNKMICKVCRKKLYGSEKKFNNGMCWYCEEAYNDPDPYADDSLNEVNMGRFDDDPPEHM